ARHRTKGARALGYLPLLQVTRRKGETNSRLIRKNGYVLKQQSPTSFDTAWINVGKVTDGGQR
ncbi:hypothetical protein, partial [Pseudomonas sp. GM60]|uniref:hypothetical protein n=1 Tax=Pseudomonas sp. GM60 TaxID=1144334 RepID=UPI001EE64FF4